VIARQEGGDWQAVELTREHSASVYEERQRIQKSGGHVRDGRVLGAIEVSRSIGDGPYKAYGLTSTPDMRKCRLSASFK
jgi:integrin-linked kinase-associated serine/threonine phosphatase 2C